MAEAIFSFKGNNTTIQCLLGDKMKDICLKFSFKINIDINSLYFLYGGEKINLNLTFEQLANSMDKKKNEYISISIDTNQIKTSFYLLLLSFEFLFFFLMSVFFSCCCF